MAVHFDLSLNQGSFSSSSFETINGALEQYKLIQHAVVALSPGREGTEKQPVGQVTAATDSKQDHSSVMSLPAGSVVEQCLPKPCILVELKNAVTAFDKGVRSHLISVRNALLRPFFSPPPLYS